MSTAYINFTLNNSPCQLEADPTRTLLDVLRSTIGLTGVKEGCGQGDCGACMVIIDGSAVNACLVLFGQVQGREVVTVEGLAANQELSTLQKKIAEKWAFQCGFCTPGMLMSTQALLQKNTNPNDEEIRTAISGNLCRCTNYEMIVEAVKETARELAGGSDD